MGSSVSQVGVSNSAYILRRGGGGGGTHVYKVRMIPFFFLSKEATVNFLAIIIPKFSLLYYLWIQQGKPESRPDCLRPGG